VGEALLVRANAERVPSVARLLALEARDVATTINSPLLRARSELALARCEVDDVARIHTESAIATLRRLGARRDLAAAEQIQSELDQRSVPAVAIRTLGGFSVRRRGHLVDASAWQSRKARDVLKILVARRGHPIARDQLQELLWHGEDRDRSASRLSVTLSTLRAVLDPEKSYEPDHFVVADRETVGLRLANLSVDVEEFLANARAGLDAGDAHESRARLVAAEAAYAGDFLEEDPYSDWAVALREELRATYIATARRLAEIAQADGDVEAAARYLRRVLERDTYDEPAHLQLVAALAASGRHGEARRAFRTYCAAMRELDVEPAPYPGTGRPPTVS
jgi:DNA-binding SARP family transcriptional activator